MCSMALHKDFVIKFAAKLRSKVAVASIVCVFLLVLLFPGQFSAQSFVDKEMMQRLHQHYSQEAQRRGVALNMLLKQLKGKEVNKQLIEVNRFFNQFKYKNDVDLWGRDDYWATPEEFIGVNSGDCEDYVIAKYFALRSLGVPDKQLYLTYVKTRHKNETHMVLSYISKIDSVPLILDNFKPRILPSDKRPDLLSVYYFNVQSTVMSIAPDEQRNLSPEDKIMNSNWAQLLTKIKK